MMHGKPIIITGPVNGGKTSMLYSLCSRLDDGGFRFGGMIQVATLPGRPKIDWVLSDQGTGEVRLLLSAQEHTGWERFGRFWIDHGTFGWAEERILAKIHDADYMTFDEIGPLELAGRGFDSVFRNVLHTYGGTLIAVVRRPLLQEVLATYGIAESDARIVHADQPWDAQLELLIP